MFTVNNNNYYLYWVFEYFYLCLELQVTSLFQHMCVLYGFLRYSHSEMSLYKIDFMRSVVESRTRVLSYLGIVSWMGQYIGVYVQTGTRTRYHSLQTSLLYPQELRTTGTPIWKVTNRMRRTSWISWLAIIQFC